MTVDPAALIAGGLLAARFGLPEALTPQEVADNLGGDFGACGPATLWLTGPIARQEDLDAYMLGTREVASSWMAPDEAIVAQHEVLLRDQWNAAVQAKLDGRNLFVQPVLRLMVNSVEDALQLQRIGTLGDLRVTAHIGTMIDQWRWRWPLRVGIVAGPEAARLTTEVTGQSRFADQYSVRLVETGEDAEVDVLVVDRDVAERPAARAGVVVLVGPVIDAADTAALSDRLDAGRDVRCGAVIAVPDRDVRWFEEFVRELSHDRPLDAAIGIVRPDAVIAGDPRFFAVTALRNWNLQVTQQLGNQQIDVPLADIARTVPFDSESAGGRTTADQVVAAEAGNHITVEIRGEPPATAAIQPPMAEPPMAEPPMAEPPMAAPSMAEPPMADDAAAAPTAPPLTSTGRLPPPSERRLNALVECGKVVRPDGFVGGKVNTIRVNIAAHVEETAITADRIFSHPAPGKAVDLDVFIQCGWSRAKPAKRTLHLPPRADSKWTEPLKVRVPAKLTRADVFITIMWQGRTVQSAVLSGPVLDRKAAPGPEALTLTVDVSTPPPTAAEAANATKERPEAGASFVILPLDGKPAVFDAARGVPISAGDLEKANRSVRKDLIDTFLDPPADLAAAARPLARLATRGALLRDALKGKQKSFYDDVDWVHVNSFGGGHVPFELIYEHPMPDTFDVPVCPTALAGAKECAKDCPDRKRSDVVCPFGFWATTKVVERRMHTTDRRASMVSDQRKVAVRQGAAVAVTPKADADDATASKRIGNAVTGFSLPGTCTITATWAELEQAVTSACNLVVLVTHTIDPEDPEDDLTTQLELGDEAKFVRNIDKRYFNPTPNEPGPVVLALGCDTNEVQASFASLVQRLHSAGVEIVVSAISQIPGKEVADFVQRLVDVLAVLLAEASNDPKRFGAVMTAARRTTLLNGDVLALALTASGDGDVQLIGG